MNKSKEKKILEKVKNDYSFIAKQFDQTRKRSWKEFDYFQKYLKNEQEILDLGCGNGRLYEFLKDFEINYLGIDNNPELLKIAQKNFPSETFKLGSLNKIGIKKKFDIIFCIAAFHHLPTKKLREKALKEIKEHLKNNGILIITVWNLYQPNYRKYIKKAFLNYILSFGKYKKQDTFIPWGKTGIKRYYYAFKEKEFKDLLKKEFKIIEFHSGNNYLAICKQ